ncbi:major facilitator superfamily domain-containing protein [Xylariaceae sp. AK1471]|nr:major facilitator superfamily domain-containing protein [Xylariaceae sp. AK1471]
MVNLSFICRIPSGWFTVDFWLCTTLMFLVEFGCALLGAPSPRLLEIAICRDYYRTNSVTLIQEEDCKTQEVQLKLGFVLTVLSTCSILAGKPSITWGIEYYKMLKMNLATLMQLPMGLLADKKGERTALLLNITSTILYWGWMPLVAIFSDLPMWTFYIAPIFIFIGGGPWASGALIFSAINRQITSSQRTPAFSIMEAISGIADLIGPALGTLTMEEYIWLPYLLATISFTLMFVPTLLLKDQTTHLLTEVDDIHSEVEVARLTDGEEQPLLPGAAISTYAHRSERGTFQSTATIYSIGFSSFFLISLARDSNNFLIPWISWRFDESIARAGLIFSLRAVISSIVFFVLLPLASSFVSGVMNVESFTRDLYLSASSAAFLCAGSTVVALSSSLWTLVAGFSIMTLGSGVTVSFRAFLASKVERSMSGRLFMAISATSTIGSLVGMPLMGALYSLSISKQADHISLPFAIAAVAYFLVTCVISSLPLVI